jgi:glycosyltransferase involved in cell wall biosynthesis
LSYKITHLTSAHPRYDTRIFLKECTSLSKKYEVNLIVADGLGEEKKNNINIYDVNKLNGRFSRIFFTTKKVFQKAIELDSDIYHLHDPELIFVGLKLKKMGKIVIFDAHEDLPKQILAKHYLGNMSKKIISFVIGKLEILILKKFDFIISATPIIRDKFLNNHIQSIDINNFPIIDELIEINPNFHTSTICYVGLLYETRGIREIIQAIENLDVKLILAGKFFDKEFENEIRALKGWKKVDFRGFVNREELKEIFKNSLAGLVTLHPTPSYIEAYPVKMFEYMSAGIAVIASNFPLYIDFVEVNKCGLCVNPLDVLEITKQIEFIIEYPNMTKSMGQNGKRIVSNYYNWDNEEKKLINTYMDLLYV